MIVPRNFFAGALLALVALLTLGGPGPVAATTANDVCPPAANPCVITNFVPVTHMSVLDFGNRALTIAAGGNLAAGSSTMTIIAGAVTVNQGGTISAAGSGSLPGGRFTIEGTSLFIAGTLAVQGAPPGELTLLFSGDVILTGPITAQSSSNSLSGGSVVIEGATVIVSSSIDVFGGRQEESGGDVDITAAGNLDFAGSINASATDGGGIGLRAGVGASGGDLNLAAGSLLDAAAFNLGGFGGGVDLSANGDRITSGHVRLNGAINVSGARGSESEGGGLAGSLDVSAAGAVLIAPTATLNFSGGVPDGDGGEIDIIAEGIFEGDGVRIEAPVNVSGPTNGGSGGSFSVDSFGPVDVRASINASATDGGEVTISSTIGSVTVAQAVTINASGSGLNGGGGSICLASAQERFGSSPIVTIASGNLLAIGGSSAPAGGGSGGSIEVIGLDAVRIAGTASADGGNGGGAGGSVDVTALDGSAFIDGTLRARGVGAAGGSVAVDATRIEVAAGALIDVGGNGGTETGTDIGLTASGGSVLVTGNLTATGSPGAGGLIEILSDRTVAIGGTVTATGGAQPGGRVLVEGCSVLVCGFNAEPDLCFGRTGVVTTLGPNGTNRLTGRDEVGVFGSMTAQAQTGRNELVVRPPVNDNAVVLGTTTPAAVRVPDTTLQACPACGDGIVQPPETCDDGNTVSGDGCSADCQLECEPLPGDVNGDCVVTLDDLRPLVTAIFSGRSAEESPRADANSDGRISAADLVATALIIGES